MRNITKKISKVFALSKGECAIRMVVIYSKQAVMDTLHTRYGFLSDNIEFTRRCEKEGIIFIVLEYVWGESESENPGAAGKNSDYS